MKLSCTPRHHPILVPYSSFLKGRQAPSKAFVNAIAENATDQQPSASFQQHAQSFSFQLAHVGFWSAPHRFCHTHIFTGQRLRLTIDETNVIVLTLDNSSLSFLPRDIRAYGLTFGVVETPARNKCGSIFLFELKQNPQFYDDMASSGGLHNFRLPSRVISIAFGSDKHSALVAERLWTRLESLLTGITEINMRQIQMVSDTHDPFLARFFQQSKSLNIELAFHCESLLRNELLNLSALTKISPRIDRMIGQGQQDLALRVLKNLVPKLEIRQERGKDEEQVLRITNRLWDEACAEATSNGADGLLTFLQMSQPGGEYLLCPMLHIDVTPTRVLLSGPQFHISNRVIRAYPDHWHHFARVMFTNEDREGVTTVKPNYGFAESEKYIYSRVLDILTRGIDVAGRHWDMLAWSSSSMSTHRVWFVTPFRDVDGRRIDANVIRSSLGDFSDVIRSPALYGARLSQAFSATACTIKIPEKLMRFTPDIVTDEDKVHTDGVGQISPELMAEVWERYVTIHGERSKRKLLKGAAPSAIQIRLGGSKGMLSINPRLPGKFLYLRPSMNKFGSRHQDLEVANSSARCLPAKLNRPLINALDDLGVPPTAFLSIQEEAISHIGRARQKFDETARLCSAHSFGTGCNLRVLFEKIHKLGLGAATIHNDSFFLVLAKSVTAAALGDMKRKARIPVRGVTLLGIADEFAFLKEGEIFAQVETVEFGEASRRIIVGRKLIGRSPTVDPADIALVTCVRPPPGHPLLQLRNVVVFNTCSRNQPLPRRLRGGDLDGDLYTIYEDERLFPTTVQPETGFHDKIRPRTLQRDCHPVDLAFFFAEFMLNDFIGLVSHLHLRIADASEFGSGDYRCKLLAKLHSQATDFRKTGVAVTRKQLPRMDEPIVPDFLAQGEQWKGKLTYSSTRVLGYLFRAVSWNETDTPSLDGNKDPETGLDRVSEADFFDDDDISSEFGSEFNSLMESQASVQTPRVSSLRATVRSGPVSALPGSPLKIRTVTAQSRTQNLLASRISGPTGHVNGAGTAEPSPWQFKDFTFPQLFQKMNWTNAQFLPTIQSNGLPEDEGSVIEEGTRYVALFQDFTRALRQQSRLIASYHPNPDTPPNGLNCAQPPLDGVYLVSEVHLLTGRLPWAKVAKRTRTDRESSLLDNMQSLCTLLRKNLCRVSEAAAFEGGQGEALSAETAPIVAQAQTHGKSSSSAKGEAGTGRRSGKMVGRTTGQSSSRVVGDSSATAPFVLDSSDEENDSSQDGEFVILGSTGLLAGGNKPAHPAREARAPLAPVTNSVASGSNIAREANSRETTRSLKRRASEDVDMDRRSRSLTPIPFQSSSYHSGTQVKVEEEEEEGELTVVRAQNMVDSLWKACHFFCSPLRPRYSNVYGYNTFLITLTLHLLSMLETLKHLHRDESKRRYFPRDSTRGKAKETTTAPVTQLNPEDAFETEYEDESDHAYSLTEETMRALSLGEMILDFEPSLLSLDL